MSTENKDLPYMDAPEEKPIQKEEMLYGNGESLTEKEKAKKKYEKEKLNEEMRDRYRT